MAVLVLDLRQEQQKRVFSNTPPEDMRYAEAFWQSVKLQPAMESRLVSSDIKQRLATRSSLSKACQSAASSDKKLDELFVRARSLAEMERFEHLRRLSALRVEDRCRLHKRREERIKKEEISRDKFVKPVTFKDIKNEKATIKRKIGEAYAIEEMIRDIDEFDKRQSEKAKPEQSMRLLWGPSDSERKKRECNI